MPYDDFVYVVCGTFEIAGWEAGTSQEDFEKLKKAHNNQITKWTYRHFCDYWKQMYYDGLIPELPDWIDRRKI